MIGLLFCGKPIGGGLQLALGLRNSGLCCINICKVSVYMRICHKFPPYAVLVNTYAVAELNISVKRPTPVTPEATVTWPNDAAVVAAASDLIPLVATAMVTVLAPAVLSTIRSKTVPAVALIAWPSNVPVGNVIVVDDAEVLVMYPVATCAAVAVPVELIAEGVVWTVRGALLVLFAAVLVIVAVLDMGSAVLIPPFNRMYSEYFSNSFLPNDILVIQC